MKLGGLLYKIPSSPARLLAPQSNLQRWQNNKTKNFDGDFSNAGR